MVPHTPQQRLVLWTIWFATLAASVVLPFMLGHGIPSGPNAPTPGVHPMVVVAIGQIGFTTVLRWIVLPKANKGTAQVLVLLVIGLALGEWLTFYSIFLIPRDQPQTKLALWLLSLLNTLQFMPVFAKASVPAADPFRVS